MSERYQSLSHSRWNCMYHVVFVPKRRRKKLFGEIRRHRVDGHGRCIHADDMRRTFHPHEFKRFADEFAAVCRV